MRWCKTFCGGVGGWGLGLGVWVLGAWVLGALVRCVLVLGDV